MPAFQSVPEFDLSEKYHLKAVGCEKCAVHASDQSTEQAWQELAAQWHSMADQAAMMLGDASPHDSRHEFDGAPAHVPIRPRDKLLRRKAGHL
jgi:hypothetical protein